MWARPIICLEKPIVWIHVANSLELEKAFNPSIKNDHRTLPGAPLHIKLYQPVSEENIPQAVFNLDYSFAFDYSTLFIYHWREAAKYLLLREGVNGKKRFLSGIARIT